MGTSDTQPSTRIRSRRIGFLRQAIAVAGGLAVLPAVALPLLLAAVMALPALLVAVPLLLAGWSGKGTATPPRRVLHRVPALVDTH
jgi:hypothetical protein